MAKFVAVGRDTFANRFWKAPQDFRFFADMAVIPLGANEAPRAGLHLPLAFIKQQDTFDLIALAGLRQDENLAVDPLTGEWLLDYLPELARVYPFRLASNKTDELMVIVDEESGLVTNDPNDWPFFQANGEPEEQLSQLLQTLNSLQQGRMGSFELCSVLAEADLFEPWNLSIQSEDGSRNIEGLYRISEEALNALGNVPFLALRKRGALALAYSQLLSMGNIHKLGRLAYQRQQGAEKVNYADGFNDDTISFS